MQIIYATHKTAFSFFTHRVLEYRKQLHEKNVWLAPCQERIVYIYCLNPIPAVLNGILYTMCSTNFIHLHWCKCAEVHIQVNMFYKMEEWPLLSSEIYQNLFGFARGYLWLICYMLMSTCWENNCHLCCQWQLNHFSYCLFWRWSNRIDKQWQNSAFFCLSFPFSLSLGRSLTLSLPWFSWEWAG